MPAEFAFPARDFLLKILAALICGLILGLERQVRGKPAGIRTSVLVCLGSMTFVHAGAAIGGGSDPARVVGQVVTGVGFLGAGVILTREGLVLGVTSASVLWVLAAVGAAIGLGLYGVALSVALVTVLVLVGVESAEHTFKALRRGVHAHLKEK